MREGDGGTYRAFFDAALRPLRRASGAGDPMAYECGGQEGKALPKADESRGRTRDDQTRVNDANVNTRLSNKTKPWTDHDVLRMTQSPLQ